MSVVNQTRALKYHTYEIKNHKSERALEEIRLDTMATQQNSIMNFISSKNSKFSLHWQLLQSINFVNFDYDQANNFFFEYFSFGSCVCDSFFVYVPIPWIFFLK